ncbi:hypothetical protein AKJ51_00010 [candidate division MSBL1 archaeon SCGC-AAA382A20]|uniref:Uncharacterized protein n=1 Tax=candidate division MSBL1 archaeon SCGC-AAA382A20 TaxID=1698280 RepID=A0A133VMU8_9EURY|nr:hypothetical protein AKJ51_00010 [candidate division MSBL1 archaeon SCGC-AAA382A20]
MDNEKRKKLLTSYRNALKNQDHKKVRKLSEKLGGILSNVVSQYEHFPEKFKETSEKIGISNLDDLSFLELMETIHEKSKEEGEWVLYASGGIAQPTIRDALNTRDKSELEEMAENVSGFEEETELGNLESKTEIVDFLVRNYPEEGPLGEKIKFLTLKKSPSLRNPFSIKENIENIVEKLNTEVFSKKLKDCYYDEGYLPSELAEVKMIKKDERWIIEDDIKGYVHYIRKEDEYLNVFTLKEVFGRLSHAKSCVVQSSYEEVKCELCGRKFIKEEDMPEWVLEKWSDPNFCYLCIMNAHNLRDEPQIAFSRDGQKSTLKRQNCVVDKSYEKPTRKQMINDLKGFIEDLGFIPKSDVLKRHSNETFLSKSNPEKTIPFLIKHEIADYKAYKEEFGSWLKALNACEIIDEDEAIETPYGYRCVAEDGHECLSLAERRIDDFMNKNDIPHEKEPHYPQDDELNPDEKYRADWKVKNYLIEYFGLMQKENYEEKTEIKQKLAEKDSINLIAIYPDELGNLDEILQPLKEID